MAEERNEDNLPLYPTNNLIGQLLARPRPKRRYFTTSLYPVYSFKMHERIYLYSEQRYVLWTRIEFDKEITKFNFEPPSIFRPDGSEGSFRAAAVSLNEFGVFTIHFTKQYPSPSTLNEQEWVAKLDINIREWSDFELDRKSPAQQSREKLLRYLCVPGYSPDVQLEKAITRAFKLAKRRDLDEIIRLFPQIDPTQIKASLAHMLYMRKLYADINVRTFSPLTAFSTENMFSK
ncbi:hypothetical protein [Variovorax sp. GT1P44]|uniref:hypothetical protein n=1 Tax=Variovorax sp. GT1P44 TaxID=3443742 RepID=UPI003F4597E8